MSLHSSKERGSINNNNIEERNNCRELWRDCKNQKKFVRQKILDIITLSGRPFELNRPQTRNAFSFRIGQQPYTEQATLVVLRNPENVSAKYYIC